MDPKHTSRKRATARASRTTKGAGAPQGTRVPQVYRVPGVRVSVVRERWVRIQRRPIIDTSIALAAALSACIPADDAREHFVMAILDVRQRLLGVHTVSIGCLTGTLVHPRLCSAEHKRGYVAVTVMWPSGWNGRQVLDE